MLVVQAATVLLSGVKVHASDVDGAGTQRSGPCGVISAMVRTV